MGQTRSLREIYGRLQKLIQINQSLIVKSRKYIKHGKTPPRGRKVERGRRGAYYYNTEPRKKNLRPLPGSKPQQIKVSPTLQLSSNEEGIIRHSRSILSSDLHNLHFQLRDDLTEDEKDSLLQYQIDSSKINRIMRRMINNRDVKTKHRIDMIISSFQKDNSTIRKQILLYKGISVDFAKIIVEKGGFFDGAFFSTSYNPIAAITYARRADKSFGVKDNEGYSNVLVYNFPGGKGIYLGADSEILLPCEMKWKIIDIQEFHTLYCVHDEGKKYIRRMIRMIYIRPQVK
jgi:hypothetical protein